MTNPLSFSFWADEPTSSPLSYEALQSRRRIAESLMGKRMPFPQNAGQGIAFLAEKLSDRATLEALDRADAARQGLLASSAAEAGKALGGDNAPAVPVINRPPGTRALAPPDVGDQEAAYIPPAVTDPDATPLPPPRPVYDRSQQLAELEADPALRQRAAAIALGEVGPNASLPQLQTQYATALDRAGARGQGMGQVLKTYTGPGSTGYYPAASGRRGEALLRNPAVAARFESEVATPVLRGADPGGAQLGFTPTGNASGDFAADRVRRGVYNQAGKIAGETYVTQETPEQLQRLRASRFSRGGPDTGDPNDGRDAIALALTSPDDRAAQRPPPEMSAQLPPNPPVPTDIAPAPVRTAQAQPPGQFPPLPPVATVRDLEMPRPPAPLPMSPTERLATIKMMSSDDPAVQAQWGAVAKAEAQKREFQQGLLTKEYENKLANTQANQVYAREARQKAVALAEQERALREKTPPEQAAAPPELLGTPQSPQRTGIPSIPPVPLGVEPHKWRELQAPEMAKAVGAVEKAVPDFEEAVKTLKQAREHPGREWGVGTFSDVARRTPGTSAYGFGKIMEQIGGKNFLAAYQQLKGAGAITEIEGTKAEAAQARLATAQTKEDFNQALNDFELQLRGDLERAQRKVNAPVTAWRAPGDNASYAPDIGERRGPNVYIGGNPAMPSSWRPVR